MSAADLGGREGGAARPRGPLRGRRLHRARRLAPRQPLRARPQVHPAGDPRARRRRPARSRAVPPLPAPEVRDTRRRVATARVAGRAPDVEVPPDGGRPYVSRTCSAAHLRREGADVDRLLEVAVEADREEPLAVALHRERGERDDRDLAVRASSLSGASPRRRPCPAAGCPSGSRPGGARRATATPSPPLAASSVRSPASRSTSRASFRFFSLSSTMSTSAIRHRAHRAGCDGKREAEGAALTEHALDPEPAAVELDEPAREREAEPGALVPACRTATSPDGTPRR